MNARIQGGRIAVGVTAVLGLGSVAVAGAGAVAAYTGSAHQADAAAGQEAPTESWTGGDTDPQPGPAAADREDGDDGQHGRLGDDDEEDSTSDDDGVATVAPKANSQATPKSTRKSTTTRSAPVQSGTGAARKARSSGS